MGVLITLLFRGLILGFGQFGLNIIGWCLTFRFSVSGFGCCSFYFLGYCGLLCVYLNDYFEVYCLLVIFWFIIGWMIVVGVTVDYSGFCVG